MPYLRDSYTTTETDVGSLGSGPADTDPIALDGYNSDFQLEEALPFLRNAFVSDDDNEGDLSASAANNFHMYDFEPIHVEIPSRVGGNLPDYSQLHNNTQINHIWNAPRLCNFASACRAGANAPIGMGHRSLQQYVSNAERMPHSQYWRGIHYNPQDHRVFDRYSGSYR